MDISNTQQNLFNSIDRVYNAYQKPIEEGISSMGHINLIQSRSYANSPYQEYGQLDIATHIGTIGKANSQRSELTDPIIQCNPRYNESFSRFNYAYDSQITTRPTEVSGVNIPNNQLSIIPNRGTQLCYQKTIIPLNKELYNLSRNIIGICGTDTSALDNQNLQFKASRQRLTREELQGLARINTTPAVP
jgi:hypothetical protein